MDKLGPYSLESELGRGGMGTVYRAVETATGLPLAVKVLAAAVFRDDHFRNRFESEIKTLLTLDHPNIVRLVGYGQEEGKLYFAMELVQGRSLFQLLRDGQRFDWREVIRIGKNVALGLRHAHERGVIHRDLKPGNLLKSDTGIIKITDFGIAKRFGQDQNTGTNVLGTLDFMSPEQARGQPVTVRSDLYSLGAVMFALLAGRPPFNAGSFEESLENLTKIPAPRVMRLVPDVPQPLDDLIHQLLAKKPEQRIPTALSLYHQLRKIEQDLRETSQADTAERPRDGTTDKTLATAQESSSTNVDQGRESRRTVVQDTSGHDDSPARRTEEAGLTSPSPSSDPGTRPGASRQQPTKISKPAVDPREAFFKRVTDDERQSELTPLTKKTKTPHLSKAVLGVLLMVVMVVGVYGAIVAYQAPSSESLLTQFEEDQHSPHKHLEKLDLFLERYPDHEKANWVRELRERAPGTRKIRQLMITRPDALTSVEQDFLKIIRKSQTDAPQAVEQLTAWLTLYQQDESLNADERECITAAKAVLPSIRKDAEQQIDTVRTRINNQLTRAADLATDDARSVYESIIKLNQPYSWAADLVEAARENLQHLPEK